jgi:3-hydroxyacyl-CoA dehydrogenase
MAKKIAIIGSGLIGRSWAITFARGGYDVAMYDTEVAALKQSLDAVGNLLVDLEKGGLLNNQTAAVVRRRIAPVRTIPEALADASHVQESGPENVETKRAIFAQLDAAAAPDTVLASSSSAIVASKFTEELKGRGRCLIVHPINPPFLVPAVELVPAPWTEPAVVERTRALMVRIGQAPMVLGKEIEGFVMNRLQAALLQEAFRLVAGGFAGVDDVDVGIRKGLGLRWAFMGPFETIDLNAPGGVNDYVARYEGALRSIALSQTEPPTWAGPLAQQIDGQRRAKVPKEDLANRQRWRDRRLMALLRHLALADKEIGT